jgi:addiction module HigA family antidote
MKLLGGFMAKTIQAPGPFLKLMLDKYKLNPFKLAKDIQLSQSAVRLITIGKTKISVPVALRLAKYFNTNPEYWLVLQMRYDLAEAAKDKALNKIIKGIPRAKKGAATKEPSKSTDVKAKAKAPAKRGRKPKTASAKTAARPKKAAKSRATGRAKAAGTKAAPRRGRPRKAK